ncbi:uncharacterized protein L969DRAFT_94951 [Mixia osmundae IAM 14324]|uniref:Uncharacterized protein n=1 Tax=Mixia osmundae (strain CBS 9802 / IAM 14324 / JCM 22182 / KY 12970) TaxID=764103 RepID=G7E179_MIXOS|nr:uncharacterized protein L969DRAFT_94951 [Mixia osmundae IAM 14324]KEI38772.1 hypothetical protein L969DRAFT_94951 [Mixia osmundae IAM 14324]GAA96589.1 hypothetical protein E5Q_03259 [Mixia osmundae IAM 14324]
MIFSTISALSLASISLAAATSRVVSPNAAGEIRCSVLWTPVGQKTFVSAQIALSKDSAYAAAGRQASMNHLSHSLELIRKVRASQSLRSSRLHLLAWLSHSRRRPPLAHLAQTTSSRTLSQILEPSRAFRYACPVADEQGRIHKDAMGSNFGIGCFGVGIPNLAGTISSLTENRAESDHVKQGFYSA